MGKIRIANIATNIRTLGPGNRAVIWLQGCNRACKGCMAPETRPLDEGQIVEIDELFEKITSFDNIEGLTVSGGEPFLQPEGLHLLLKKIRNQTNLGIIIYTGYTINELLKKGNPYIDEIISSLTDIIIDGEYIDELNDGSSLRGSNNQVVNFITDRYLPYKEIYEGKNRPIQAILSNGVFFAAGVPTKESLETLNKLTSQLKKNIS